MFDPSQQYGQREENVKSMMEMVVSSNCLDVVGDVRPLKSISGQVATPEQQIDLLGFGEVGRDHVKFYILKDPSTLVPRRKVKLLTFSLSAKLKKKMKQLDKEKRIVGKCLRRAFAWNTKFDSSPQPIGQQYIDLPRAISDPNL